VAGLARIRQAVLDSQARGDGSKAGG
jgi:hypothetical protein